MKIKFISILSLLFILQANAYGEEKKYKKQFKLGVEETHGKVENHSFSLTSYSFSFETPLWRELGAGVGIRKETLDGYSGYYIDFYGWYKQPIFKDLYLHTTAGFMYGLPSRKYDHFDGNTWVFLKQNSSLIRAAYPGVNRIAVLYPSFSFAIGIPLPRGISLEPGIVFNVFNFGVQSFNPLLSESRLTLVPSYRVRIVYNY